MKLEPKARIFMPRQARHGHGCGFFLWVAVPPVFYYHSLRGPTKAAPGGSQVGDGGPGSLGDGFAGGGAGLRGQGPGRDVGRARVGPERRGGRLPLWPAHGKPGAAAQGTDDYPAACRLSPVDVPVSIMSGNALPWG